MNRHSNHNCHIRITPRGVMMSLASAAPLLPPYPPHPCKHRSNLLPLLSSHHPPLFVTTLYSSNQLNMSAKVYVGASPNDRSSL